MTSRIHRKMRHLYWVCRFCVLDKYAEQARMLVLGAAGALVCLLVWNMASGTLTMRTASMVRSGESEVVYAIVWWAYLILLVVSAVVIWALTPKPETPKPVDGKTPVVKDGKAIVRIYGEEWIDDSGIAAPFGDVDPEPIRKKAGKK